MVKDMRLWYTNEVYKFGVPEVARICVPSVLTVPICPFFLRDRSCTFEKAGGGCHLNEHEGRKERKKEKKKEATARVELAPCCSLQR